MKRIKAVETNEVEGGGKRNRTFTRCQLAFVERSQRIVRDIVEQRRIATITEQEEGEGEEDVAAEKEDEKETTTTATTTAVISPAPFFSGREAIRSLPEASVFQSAPQAVAAEEEHHVEEEALVVDPHPLLSYPDIPPGVTVEGAMSLACIYLDRLAEWVSNHPGKTKK